MATKASKTAAQVKPDKSMTLVLDLAPGKSEDRRMAEMAAAGIASNAFSVVKFGKGTFGELSLADCVGALKDTIKNVNGGDLSSAETMLAAQAAALNAIFGELARRASLNMGEHLNATEVYMRMALKAQGQCRATLETLAAIKNPPVVFARQANINNGGQQLVNNAPAPNSTAASARPGEIVSRPNELLEDLAHGSPQLDTRTTAATGRTHQGLAPVGAVNRTANR